MNKEIEEAIKRVKNECSLYPSVGKYGDDELWFIMDIQTLLSELEKAQQEVSDLKGEIKVHIENNQAWVTELEKEKEKEKERADNTELKEQVHFWQKSYDEELAHSRQAEERLKELSDEKLNRHDEVMMWVEKCNQAESNLQKLEVGLEKEKEWYAKLLKAYEKEKEWYAKLLKAYETLKIENCGLKERADKLEAQLTIKILENVKGAQVLSDLRERLKELSDEKLNRHDEVMMWVEKCNQAESNLQKLMDAVKLLIGYIPDGWEVPLGYTQIVSQAKKVLEEVNG